MSSFFPLHPVVRNWIVARFEASVDKRGPNECWMWTGPTYYKNSYGRAYVPGVAWCNNFIVAHRLAWILEYNTAIPNKLMCCHSCDNRLCVNPKHIFLGTAQHNANDMKQKDRKRKLKRAERIKVIDDYVNRLSAKQTAKKYNICTTTVNLYSRLEEATEIFGKIDLSRRKGNFSYVKSI